LAQLVVHQVRNPMLAISGFAHRLDAQLAKTGVESTYPGIILEQASRLERVVSAASRLAALPPGQAGPHPSRSRRSGGRPPADRHSELGPGQYRALTGRVHPAPDPRRPGSADPGGGTGLHQLPGVRVGRPGHHPAEPNGGAVCGQRRCGLSAARGLRRRPQRVPGRPALHFRPLFTSKADGTGLSLILARQIILWSWRVPSPWPAPGPLGGTQITFRLKPTPAGVGLA